MKNERFLLLLALAVMLAPHVEASRTSVWESNPPAALSATRVEEVGLLAPLARLDTSTAADSEIVDSQRFDFGDVVLVERELEREEHFNLGPLTLVDLNLLRGPPPSYPETRVGGFELLPPFRVGASPTLSLWGRRACGAFSCGLVSDGPEDPWGLQAATDAELPLILERIQAATDEAARRHGVSDLPSALASGQKGSAVHQTLAGLLMDRSGPYYHPRVLAEVETDSSGRIQRYGRRSRGATDSLIKDIIILNPDAGPIVPGGTRAKDVTKLVVDLKMGETGARMRNTDTLIRFGVPNVKLRPHQGTKELFRGVSRTARGIQRARRMASIAKAIPVLGTAISAALGVMAAEEIRPLIASGDLDTAAAKLSGAEDIEALARGAADETERRIREPLDRAGASRDARERQLRELEGGSPEGH